MLRDYRFILKERRRCEKSFSVVDRILDLYETWSIQVWLSPETFEFWRSFINIKLVTLISSYQIFELFLFYHGKEEFVYSSVHELHHALDLVIRGVVRYGIRQNNSEHFSGKNKFNINKGSH